MLVNVAEGGLFPDSVVRLGIRRLLRQRLTEESNCADERYRELLGELEASRLALHTQEANEQHYEVTSRFYELVLGERLKYSSGYWSPGVNSLNQAESAMLELYAIRGDIADGQRILDLGCGWGSFSLWAAERFPNARITAVSNSSTQRMFIEQRCALLGLSNVEVITADVNDLDLPMRYDRVVSVEMFEHVRNYAVLLNRISRWLTDDGKLFVHIFCHRWLMYPFETEGDDNWMGRYFFTGGLMPAADTLLHFQDDLRIEERWQLPGTHYQQTARAWLANLDNHRPEAASALAGAHDDANARKWLQRWRMFFMACEELFGYNGGREWQVAHYRFGRRS